MQSVLAVIDLKRIRANAHRIAHIANRPLIAVVKDNAYGHGDIEVALALEEDVLGFAVATVGEGARLRTGGIIKDILVLTPPLTQEEALRMSEYHLTATLSSLRTVGLFRRIANAEGHIAVNTGMNRYGVRPQMAGALCRKAMEMGIRVTGIYSHLYMPERGEIRKTQQLAFEEACLRVQKCVPDVMRHLSATGGALAGDRYDAVRAGIGLYGYLPVGFACEGLKPAMKVYATVAECRTPYGDGAGYQITQGNYRKVHTLRLGYGDGFFREGGIGVGKLCMDACICEGNARSGSHKLVLADAAKYAAEHGTTAYEVLVNIGNKAEKIYLN